MDFTPPGVDGCSADGLGAPSCGGVGDLVSSGIVAKAQTFGAMCVEKNVNFYQLESAKSTTAGSGSCLTLNFLANFAALSSRPLRFKSFDFRLKQEPMTAKFAKKFKVRHYLGARSGTHYPEAHID